MALVEKIFYYALLTLSWDPFLDTGGCTVRRLFDKAVIVKEADVWP